MSKDRKYPRFNRQSAHPIEAPLDALLLAVRDVEECVGQHVPLALRLHKRELEQAVKGIRNLPTELPVKMSGLHAKEALNRIHRIHRALDMDPAGTLKVGLLLRSFSVLDEFMGNLLNGLYKLKPAIFSAWLNDVPAAAILKATDLQRLQEEVLAGAIDSFRRESYQEQFKKLAKLTGIETLTKFEHWNLFIEAAQRRHLYAHCGGRVSRQYIEQCESVGVPLMGGVSLGDVAELSPKYLRQTTSRLLKNDGVA